MPGSDINDTYFFNINLSIWLVQLAHLIYIIQVICIKVLNIPDERVNN